MHLLLRCRIPPYLMDSGRLIVDPYATRQLQLSSLAHGFSSPLWMTADYARNSGFSNQFLCTPLNIWSPGCGETFIPAVMPHFSLSLQPALPPPPPLSRRADDVFLCVPSDAERQCSSQYTWHRCPSTFNSLFLSFGLHRLWVCSNAHLHGGTSSNVTVRTPDYVSQMVNVDQLVECNALSTIVALHYRNYKSLQQSPGSVRK